jgi:nucleoside phosphorylase
MNLLIFAHYGEAQCFFDSYHLKSCSTSLKLYECPEFYLLICGEGLWDSFTHTHIALTELKNITKIINHGSAGALSNEMIVGKVEEVRSSYATLESKEPTFKSFSTETTTSSTLACLTHTKRVLGAEEKKALLPLASLVDRELWGIAHAAHKASLPWQSFKYISDGAQEDVNCKIILNEARNISEQLYKTYQKELTKVEPIQKNNTLHFSNLYLTFSQKQQLHQLLKKLSSQEGTPAEDILSSELSLLNIEQNPKNQTKQLMDQLLMRLSPQMMDFKKTIEHWCISHSNTGVKLQIPLEKDYQELQLALTLSSSKNYHEALNHLSTIPLRELLSLLHMSHL